MRTVMKLERLEDFTQETALRALNIFTNNSFSNLSAKNLHPIENGINDGNMIKYVLSIGDAIYQIVAIEDQNILNPFNEKVKVQVEVTRFY